MNHPREELFHTVVESLMEVVYEEDRASELLIQAALAGNHERAEELAHHITHLRQTTSSSLDFADLETSD